MSISTQYGQLHLQQNRQEFNLFLNNHRIPQQNVSGLSKIPIKRTLTDEELQKFIKSHAFHLVKGLDSISIFVHTKGLGGGQFFLKLPDGRTITIDNDPDNTLYQNISNILKDKAGINLEDSGYVILFNGRPLDPNQQYDTSMREATFHLQKRLIANPPKKETPLSVPMQTTNKTFEQTSVLLALVLPDGRNLEVPFDKRSQTTMLPFISNVLFDKDKSNFTGLFTATIDGKPLDSFTNISDVQGRRIHITYNRQQTQTNSSTKVNKDLLPLVQNKNFSQNQKSQRKFPSKRSESRDLGGTILGIIILSFVIFGFYRASKFFCCVLKKRVIKWLRGSAISNS